MNDNTRRQLNELFAKYKQEAAKPSKDNIELELRFKDITRDAFEAVYNIIMQHKQFSAPILECSINVINNDPANRNLQLIRKITFDLGTMISDTYSRKERLVRSVNIDDFIKYSVGLARESTGARFTVAGNAIVRLKLRLSADYIGDPHTTAQIEHTAVAWRFDLTMVKHGVFSELGTSLKSIKEKLFTQDISPNTFMKIDHGLIDNYEIEVEHIGVNKNLTESDLEIAKEVFTLINPNQLSNIAYQEEIHHCAKYIVDKSRLGLFKQPSHRLKQLANQVIALNKNTYYKEIFPPIGWYFTDKADGQRVMISINGNRCRVLRSDSMDEYMKDAEHIPGPITIVDAELVMIGDVPTALVFDIVVIEDKNLADEEFAVVLLQMDAAVAIVNRFIAAIPKEFIRPREGHIRTDIEEFWNKSRPYKIEGFILGSPAGNYSTRKNYKWKLYEETTIDFLAMKCPSGMLGILPYVQKPGMDLYLLFCGINKTLRDKLGLGFVAQYNKIFPNVESAYFPIQFSPSPDPLAYIYYHAASLPSIDKQIIELARNADNTEWIFHRTRTDRKMEKTYFGNDYRIAEETYINYIDPFEMKDLYTPNKGYFAKSVEGIHTASNKMRRYVISTLLRTHFSNMKWVIDEAAGMGADLHRYQEIGVENGLFIDIDPTAIAELIRRKFSFFEAKRKQGGGGRLTSPIDLTTVIAKTVNSLTVHTLVASLKSPAPELIVDTYQYGLRPGMIDGTICNFALHYMCDTVANIRNILTFNARMLRVGGIFMFTVMDGQSVFNLLSNVAQNATWESREGEVIKYALKKLYVGTKLAQAGQMISVHLPFSDEMYEEPLCNIEFIIAEAKRMGFELVVNSPMDTMLNGFAMANPRLSSQLTDEDRKYIGLFRYVILRLAKVKN